MKPTRKADRGRRRTTSDRIVYHHPETALPYITKRESRERTQLTSDLAYLNELFGLDSAAPPDFLPDPDL